jgi:hypothetical protein
MPTFLIILFFVILLICLFLFSSNESNNKNKCEQCGKILSDDKNKPSGEKSIWPHLPIVFTMFAGLVFSCYQSTHIFNYSLYSIQMLNIIPIGMLLFMLQIISMIFIMRMILLLLIKPVCFLFLKKKPSNQDIKNSLVSSLCFIGCILAGITVLLVFAVSILSFRLGATNILFSHEVKYLISTPYLASFFTNKANWIFWLATVISFLTIMLIEGLKEKHNIEQNIFRIKRGKKS